MTKEELLRKINTFPLAAAELAKDMLQGGFRSVFRGQGIEFDEARRYEQGDDVRSIDRNVSARYGTAYVKLYREERELTVFVVLDCSGSMFTGGGADTKLRVIDQAVLASALIAFSAERGGQRFGALFFDKAVRKIFKPKRGRSHILAFADAALDSRPLERGTSLGDALFSAARILKRRSIVLIVSDFLSLNWENELGELSKKHDCIALKIGAAIESGFPNLGFVAIEDPETGAVIQANTSQLSFKDAWSEWNARRSAFCTNVFRRYNVSQIEISTEEDASFVLHGFFKTRRRR